LDGALAQAAVVGSHALMREHGPDLLGANAATSQPMSPFVRCLLAGALARRLSFTNTPLAKKHRCCLHAQWNRANRQYSIGARTCAAA
jgi:hypothetical protein